MLNLFLDIFDQVIIFVMIVILVLIFGSVRISLKCMEMFVLDAEVISDLLKLVFGVKINLNYQITNIYCLP